MSTPSITPMNTTPNEFADERVRPHADFVYDSNTLPTLNKQEKNLRKVLGMKKSAQIVRIPWQVEIPAEADGLMLVSSLSDLGKVFGLNDPLGENYGPLCI
ncbi:hypothetical protein HYW32_03675 [Candidatus Berkelbacteria bacterium]|nr:hypothetical protein [Candidatus Berkelbacteria bacterium]